MRPERKLVWARVAGLAIPSLITLGLIVYLGCSILSFSNVNCYALIFLGIFPSAFPDQFWRFIAPVLSVLVFSPIAYKLWKYRTIDRGAQDNFSYYSQGIQLVTSDNGFQRVTGINLLIRVSEQTQKYNEEIRYVFIETLKKPPEEAGDSYAQSIIKWLYQRYHKEGLDFYSPAVTLHIGSQIFDLTDKDCRKGLIWLALLAGKVNSGVTIYYNAGTAMSYKAPLDNIKASAQGHLRSLFGFIESHSRGEEPRGLAKLIKKEENEIRKDLGLSLLETDKQPTT